MMSLAELQRRIDHGDLSADDAIAQSCAATDERDKTIGAFVCRAKGARAASTGPLRGIAVGIKDIIDTSDFPTEMGSTIYRGWRPRADAPVVMMLKQAGATIVGKTTTTAFAANDPTATLNPHNPAHTPGGSSSGSAAAVGAGMIPLALGTQTGGSVIRPASFCGVAAIKPTYRLLPTVGVKCFSWTLDTVGLFAAGVRDLAHGLAAMTGRPELLPGAASSAPRIGVVMQDFAGEPEAAGSEALRIALAAAERAGASVRALALPEIIAEAWRIHPTVQQFEAHQAFAWEYRVNYDAMPPLLRGRLDESRGTTPAEYDEARRIADRARAALAAIFEDIDVLLTFSAPGAAPKGLASTGDARFNRLWTLMGTPCVNVPATIAEGGLPVGVQVIAGFGDDAGALEAARFVEEALARG
ncbi:Asp-tRNAAsn/Glu-tRNAGln amidotransferase A subunit [Bradyrhizobium lablabi]|uniref:Asp-tRNAAsn/Glu-tRNAGln amidotransferase A subunit n=1 Tax=Bradyrhizobium lablabi TaxID=722472 RepID=A0A1M7E5X7_9BRAD|nr:amidase [Bradyrhizobium lablabi]SHL87172.1 Asp-tRNAAsn/Glu-tRNAGln amidotransferase A subunit [Bradyrhizobium lablabi]